MVYRMRNAEFCNGEPKVPRRGLTLEGTEAGFPPDTYAVRRHAVACALWSPLR